MIIESNIMQIRIQSYSTLIDNLYVTYIYCISISTSYIYIYIYSSVHYTRNEYSSKNKLFRKLLALNEKKILYNKIL